MEGALPWAPNFRFAESKPFVRRRAHSTPRHAMGNAMGKCATDAVDRCMDVEDCGMCAGSGKCVDCAGEGHVMTDKRDNLRTITAKGKDGFAVAITTTEIMVMPSEKRACNRCGGWGKAIDDFKGANSVRRRNSPRNFYETYTDPLSPPKPSTPSKERDGDGKCRRCAGKRKVPRAPALDGPSRITKTRTDGSYRTSEPPQTPVRERVML